MSPRHAAAHSPIRLSLPLGVLAVLASLAVLAAGVWGGLALFGGDEEQPNAAVDSVVQEVVIASARLANIESADPSRQETVLQRAETNLTRAARTLSMDPLPGVPATKAQEAQDLLMDLADRVHRLNDCLIEAAEHTASDGHDHGVEAGGGVSTDCLDPEVIAGHAAAARSAGTAVLALRQYGSLTEADVDEFAETVTEQARAEGKAGSTTTIPDPAA